MSKPIQIQELLTLRQVCEILQVSEDTIRRLVKDQKMSSIKVGNQWRFTEEAITDYLESRTIKVKKNKHAVA